MPPECDRHDHSMSLGSGDRYDLVVPILMEKAVWLEDVGACAGRGRESHPSKPTRLWNVFSSSGSARRKRAAHLRACYAPTSGRKSVVVTCFSSTSLAKGGFRIQDRERGARGQRYCSVPISAASKTEFSSILTGLNYLTGLDARQFHMWKEAMEHVFAIVIIVLLTIPLAILLWRSRRNFWRENGIFTVVIFVVSVWITKGIFDWWVYQYASGIMLGGLVLSLLETIRSIVKGDKPNTSRDVEAD